MIGECCLEGVFAWRTLGPRCFGFKVVPCQFYKLVSGQLRRKSLLFLDGVLEPH